MGIIIKSDSEIELMRQAGRIVALVLEKLARSARAGMKTIELDSIAADEIKKHGATSSFKGYRGFPGHICVSVNNEIVHGIPGSRVLKDGDLVSIDVGAVYDRYQGDAAVTVGLGRLTPLKESLLEATRGALDEGIRAARHGARMGDISCAVQRFAEARGFSVVREYSGHGIGTDLHEDPQIPNFGTPGQGLVLRRGMTLAIEPMVNTGGWLTRLSSNMWTVLTADGGLSAHFEHTIAIRDDGAEILTVA
ncbi:MAG: type I methionyl aminopeptidase [Chloroflexi bacterium]|nr:type I methionyl aminopeptidase [Chloroflexota bacterium]